MSTVSPAWTPSREARDVIEALAVVMTAADASSAELLRDALTHGLEHPCSGPKMERILLRNTTQEEKERAGE